MATKKLTTIVIDALEDIKARDIRLINVTRLTSVFDYIAIASADSTRQTKALAHNVMDKVKENGGWIYGIEGEDSGEWVLVDCGDIVVHVMQPAVREHYKLEEFWGDGKLEYPKPVVEKKPVARVKAEPAAKTAAKKPPKKKVTTAAAAKTVKTKAKSPPKARSKVAPATIAPALPTKKKVATSGTVKKTAVKTPAPKIAKSTPVTAAKKPRAKAATKAPVVVKKKAATATTVKKVAAKSKTAVTAVRKKPATTAAGAAKKPVARRRKTVAG